MFQHHEFPDSEQRFCVHFPFKNMPFYSTEAIPPPFIEPPAKIAK